MIDTSKLQDRIMDRTLLRSKFIKRFSSDPETIRDIRDIEKIEQIDADERFICQSPNEALMLASQAFPKATAISFLPNGSMSDIPINWTYKEYQEEVYRAANMFHSLGLQPDQSVIFLLPNVPQFLFGLWGAQLAGIAAPINPYLEVEHIASIAKSANAKILVTLAPSQPGGEDLWNKAMKAKSIASDIQQIIVIGDSQDDYSSSWDQATRAQPSDRLIFDRPISGTEIASYFHTGGTTGAPKLAQHTHRRQVLNVCLLYTSPSPRDR